MKRKFRYITEAKNTHMEHIEDLIFNKGVDGARQAINFIRDIRDTLSGHTSTTQNITVKWDGAPAIFVGVDPEDGKYFVAKKGLFAKTPKMYKSKADMKDLSGDLKKKFVIAFDEFQKLGIKKGVYQGDLMFTKSDLKVEKLDDTGVKYVTFQPNTIVYAVPTNTPLASKIFKAKIGVVWHTTYSGKTIKSMSASFGKGIAKKFKQSSSIWMDDATYRDVTGQATLTSKETSELTEILSGAGKVFQKLSASVLNSIHQDEDLMIKIKTFNNTFVRAGEPFPNPRDHVRKLYDWIQAKYKKEIDDRKTDKAKDKQREILKRVNKIFANPRELENIFVLMNHLVNAKTMVINKLNQASSLGTFLRTRNGFKATNQEGFVAIDNINGSIKLVDRMEFSRANFSPEVIKGWS